MFVLQKFLQRIQSVCVKSLYFYFNIFLFHLNRFALKGNLFDLAIGIIIGTAFANVVRSLVEDIITPPFGLLLDGVDFINLTIKMGNFIYRDKPPVVIRYGKFLQEMISLFIMALILFFIIKAVNKLSEIAIKKQLEEKKQMKRELSDEGKILLDIRNILVRKIILIDEIVF